MGLFEDKDTILAEHKTQYIAGHPVWGVKGIPDPDWSDIKWWRRVPHMTIADIEKAYHAAGKQGKIWRVAKALELRLTQDDSQKFNVHRTFKNLSVAGAALKTMHGRARIAQLNLVFNQGGGKIAGAERYNISRTLHSSDIDLIALLAEQGIYGYDNELATQAAIQIAQHDRYALFKKIISSQDVRHDVLLMRAIELENSALYIDALIAHGACPTAAMKCALNYYSNSLKLLDAWEVLIGKGGVSQTILAEHYTELLTSQILFLEEKGADLYFDGGKLFVFAQSNDNSMFHALCHNKYEKEKNIAPENRVKLPIADTYIRQTISGEYTGGTNAEGEYWEKLSDTDIMKTITRADGIRLNSYFNFKSCRVRETQETPDGVYPLFSYNFSAAENSCEVQEAAQALAERGGMPWPEHVKAKNVRPLKGGHLKGLSEKPV